MDQFRQEAKAVIVEIVRQAGGTLDNKTHLFKAFYHAHCLYAEQNPGYLTAWPIVRMPYGPGIDQADELLSELESEGVLVIEQVGPGTRFHLIPSQSKYPEMGAAELSAIRQGVAQVDGKSAATVSDESHEASRSWNQGANGQRLNVYIDRIPNEVYAAREEQLRKMAQILRDD